MTRTRPRTHSVFSLAPTPTGTSAPTWGNRSEPSRQRDRDRGAAINASLAPLTPLRATPFDDAPPIIGAGVRSRRCTRLFQAASGGYEIYRRGAGNGIDHPLLGLWQSLPKISAGTGHPSCSGTRCHVPLLLRHGERLNALTCACAVLVSRWGAALMGPRGS